MVSTHSASSLRVREAGTSTTIFSPSRYAETVRRRRLLRRTSTSGAGSDATAMTGTVAPLGRDSVALRAIRAAHRGVVVSWRTKKAHRRSSALRYHPTALVRPSLAVGPLQ